MKRRTEHLVEKRDGRREFLRATKLARSIHLALVEAGVDEDWRAIELATAVLEGLRVRRARLSQAGSAVAAGVPVVESVLTTAELADAVQHILVVTGQPAAAVSYGAVQAERSRRRRSVAALVTQHRVDEAGRVDETGRGDEPHRVEAPAAVDRFAGRWPGEG